MLNSEEEVVVRRAVARRPSVVHHSPLFSKLLKDNGPGLFSFFVSDQEFRHYTNHLTTVVQRVEGELDAVHDTAKRVVADARANSEHLLQMGMRPLWLLHREWYQSQRAMLDLKREVLLLSRDRLLAQLAVAERMRGVVDDDELLIPPERILDDSPHLCDSLALLQGIQKQIATDSIKFQLPASRLASSPVCTPPPLPSSFVSSAAMAARTAKLRRLLVSMQDVMDRVQHLLGAQEQNRTRPESFAFVDDEDALEQLLDGEVFEAQASAPRTPFQANFALGPGKGVGDHRVVGPVVVCASSVEPLSPPGREMRSEFEQAQVLECSDAECRIALYRWRSDFTQIQCRFSDFVSDERFREGRVVARWMTRFHAQPTDRIVPHKILDFISYCAKGIVVDYRLTADAFEYVHGLLEGHIFPHVFVRFFESESEVWKLRDEMFRAKCNWLRACPPTAFEAEEQFFKAHPSGGPAYWRAISRMQDLEYVLVPADTLLCIYESVMMAYDHASAYSGVPSNVIGADHLFPLLLYVVAHSHLCSPYAVLGVVKKFCTKQMLSSELGYYLCVWEAAITYISSASLDTCKDHMTPEEVEKARRDLDRWEATGANEMPVSWESAHAPGSDDEGDDEDWVRQVGAMEELVEELAF